MKITKLLCGVALGAFVASNAMAADLLYSAPAPAVGCAGGPYFGAKIGGNWAEPDTADYDFGGADDDDIDLDTGYTGSISVGYSPCGRWGAFSPRIEFEAGYLNNEVDTVTEGAPLRTDPGIGEVNALYWFANVLFDIPMSGWGFTPFIGGGVGFGLVDFNGVTDFPITANNVAVNDSDTSFAWNLTAGLSYDLSRNVTLDFAYRFVQFSDVDLANATPVVTSTGVDNHQATVGVRVHL